jgi:hypothetical protein
VCHYRNGDYYEGGWRAGLRHGWGMQQCTDGSNYVRPQISPANFLQALSITWLLLQVQFLLVATLVSV